MPRARSYRSRRPAGSGAETPGHGRTAKDLKLLLPLPWAMVSKPRAASMRLTSPLVEGFLEVGDLGTRVADEGWHGLKVTRVGFHMPIHMGSSNRSMYQITGGVNTRQAKKSKTTQKVGSCISEVDDLRCCRTCIAAHAPHWHGFNRLTWSVSRLQPVPNI